MVLLKPGADVLAMTFRLVPQFKVERSDMENGHREFDVTCSMFGPSGELLGQGVGSASTMEKKYRYRKEYCEDGKKTDSYGKRYNNVENEDIADVYNTVLKIAKKRAHIDATLTVTGAADLFTQDLIDEDDTAQPAKATGSRSEQMAERAKASATPPASASEGGQAATVEGETVTGLCEALPPYNGTSKAGKAFTKYAAAIEGDKYSTFDEALGKLIDLHNDKPVTVTYKDDGKYKTMLAIVPLDDNTTFA